jgi:hypothetical protein
MSSSQVKARIYAEQPLICWPGEFDGRKRNVASKPAWLVESSLFLSANLRHVTVQVS